MKDYITVCGAEKMSKETLEAIVRAAEVAKEMIAKGDLPNIKEGNNG